MERIGNVGSASIDLVSVSSSLTSNTLSCAVGSDPVTCPAVPLPSRTALLVSCPEDCNLH